MSGFNKREFARWVASRLNLPQEEGLLLFDAIGKKMDESMSAGDTVFLFGTGTLKVVKSRGEKLDSRIRFRPTTRATDRTTSTTLEGMPGVSSGVLNDVVVITSISAGDRAILIGRACTAKGPDGVLAIYLDDDGKHRCILRREGVAIEELIVETKAGARNWLKTAFSNLGAKTQRTGRKIRA